MAYEAEIDSFIQKFKSLVKNGSEAYLNLNTYSGQVWVNLRAGFSCIERVIPFSSKIELEYNVALQDKGGDLSKKTIENL